MIGLKVPARTAAVLGGVMALAAALCTTFAAVPASAATAQCGSLCTSFYPLSTGTSDVLAVSHPSGTSASTGEAVTISAASTTNQGEDWVLEIQGTVSDFYEAGLMSSAMNMHFGSDDVYEIDYAPDATWTGECLGVSSSNGSGSVTLQPCGETAATLWVADTADQNGRAVPLINGNNNNFSAPYGLTASSVGTQLTSSGLRAPISSSSEWGTIAGEL
ncbi:MAG TPA: hypothetical protein VMA95_06645 [Streptosporangiaceae bacterium]|nr:hypothetical protein [Streptosporangiaceae bacterium]